MSTSRQTKSGINWDLFIEKGAGYLEPQSALSNPLKGFEARQTSWDNAHRVIKEFEDAGANGDLFRLAVLLLTDIALSDLPVQDRWRIPGRAPLRHLSQSGKRMTPRREFSTLHWVGWQEDKVAGGGSDRRRKRGKQSHADVLSILSGLAWHLEKRTGSPDYDRLVKFVRAIYPPIFILQGSATPPRQQLSSAIRKYRARHTKTGRGDYRKLTNKLRRLARPA